MRYLTVLAVWILLSLAPRAQAVPLLSVVPQGTAVQPGGRLYVDLVLSNLASDEVLGAFSVDLAFSPALNLRPFAAGASRFGPYLGNTALGEAVGNADIASGSASIYEFSLLSSAQLASLQGDNVRLATLLFFLPGDAAIPPSGLFNIGVGNIVLSDGEGNLLPAEAGPAVSVAVPEPHSVALCLLALALLARGARRQRRWPLAAAAVCLSGAALAQTVVPPLPAGPLNLAIVSTSTLQRYNITQGDFAPYDASLVPMHVDRSTPTQIAQFNITTAQLATITLRSDLRSVFTYTFQFTPGVYRVSMQATLAPGGISCGELWIQKVSGGALGPRLFDTRKEGSVFVNAYFGSGPGDFSGIFQAVYEKSVRVTRQINIPGGNATFTNESGLWPFPLTCSSPTNCAPMLRTVAVEEGGTVDLYSANGATAVTKSLSPSRYDRLDFTSTGFALNVVHTRIAFVPPGAPTIAPLPDQAPMVPQDAPRSVTLHGIGDGTPRETQAVSISAVSSNPAIVANPVLAYHSGEERAVLTYRPGGGIGTALITVTVRDDGGTPGYPADDLSSTISFGVSVIDGKPCDGRACFVYVSERDSNLIDVIDVETGLVAGNFRGGDALALSPDGSRLYTLLGSDVLVIDTSTRSQIATIAVPEPLGQIALSPNGRELVVSAPTPLLAGTDRLVVIDTATRQITHTIDLAGRPDPRDMAFSLDGTRLYVTGSRGRLSVIDMVTHAVATDSTIDAGPHKIAVSTDGERVYVSSVESGTLSLFDRDGTLRARIPVGNRPEGVALSPDGRRAYVGVFNNAFQGDLAVIDTRTNQLVNRIPFAGLNGPKELAFTPDGARLYVSFEADRAVALVAPAASRVVTRIPIGTPTLALAITAMPPAARVLGDVVRDNSVDQRDLDLLRADLGKTVGEAACGIACDLDADGTITVLDARRMATLCTRAACALPPAAMPEQ